MEEGLLSLKWNNHKSTFFTVLSLLREKHTYTDVTLACEGRLYPAHRFVLSTCSEYFAEIFSSTTGNNIVIVLKDVRRADLEYLLDYMYLGQVDVAQSELASLIKTAECLRIKGLAIPDDEPPKTLMPRRQGDHREREASPPSKRKRSQVEEDRGESASNSNSSSNNSSRNGASQHVVGSSNSGSSSQRLPPPSSSSQSQSSAQSSQASTLTTKTSSSSLSSRLAPPLPSGRHTPTSPQPPLTSPTGSHSHQSAPAAAAAVIKQEVTEPPDTPEISYLSESFEEPETKPNVGDQEMSMAGPSGLQGGSEVWDGDTDLSGFAGDNYSGEGGEDGTDSEAQGGWADRRRILQQSSHVHRQQYHYQHHQKSQNPTKRNNEDIYSSHPASSIMSAKNSNSNQIKPASEDISQSFDMNITDEMLDISSDNTYNYDSGEQFYIEGLSGDVTSNSSKYYNCQYCGRTFDRVSNLKRHLLLHSGAKPFKCLYCDYRATQKANVVQHLACKHKVEMRALLDNNINVNDILVPSRFTTVT